ncbi:MAG: hypothetical protein GXY07_04375 [Candidatus Hydrogenedentes bacterium]|nr:hypothetical protein [Candidatus Hydrogenedentota bacterium]
MRRMRCPHCKEYGFHMGNLPREVIAVLACRHCEELSVLFRGKIIPLNKQILENGTMEERKMHLAEVIAQFLESGMFRFPAMEEETESAEDAAAPKPAFPFGLPRSAPDTPISDQELDRFIKIDLKCLDNPSYFKRIFRPRS